MASISAPLARLAEVSSRSAPKVEVDDLDLALLTALARDARQSQRALARQVEMSPPAVADRLARLERSGAIRGYRVDVDWAALGYPVVVYLAVTRHDIQPEMDPQVGPRAAVNDDALGR